MTRNQIYAADMKIEHEVAKFMDTYFYSKLHTLRPDITYTRHADAYHQYAGVDVSLNEMLIDEKAKVYGLLNTILQYPSFELQFINKAGNIADGWLIKDGMMTTHYCFIAVYTTAQREKDIRFENITKLNALLINKEELLDFIDTFTPKSTLMRDVDGLRCDAEDSVRYPHKKFHLKKSLRLREQPINVVFKRSTILSFPHTREIEITKDHLKTLNK